MNKILSTEAAWLSGLFEGEGSVGLYRNGPGLPTVRLTIGQHHRSVDVLTRVKEILGVGTVYGPFLNTNNCPVSTYSITRMLDVYKVVKMMYPYLLERRRGQCDVVLNYIEQTKKFQKENN